MIVTDLSKEFHPVPKKTEKRTEKYRKSAQKWTDEKEKQEISKTRKRKGQKYNKRGHM